MKIILVTIILCLFKISAQELATLQGNIYDNTTGEALIGANVMLESTAYGAATDLDGSFKIKVEPGIYILVVEYVSYRTKRFEKILINPGDTKKYKIGLDEDLLTDDVVIVEAKLLKNNENGLLVAQKKSSKVFDAISSEQITKNSDGDAGAALKRVTGVTLMNGKDVFVRGLGNRYSNVQLNGATMPSTNPDKKEVPLNIFPSSIIDNIIVQKTYTADQPGEFSGGSVQIETKNFVGDDFLNISIGSKYNSFSTFSSALDHEGGSYDFLGYDDGDRSLPNYIKNFDTFETDPKTVEAFKNNWSTKSSTISPSTSLSFSYGKEILVGKQPLGIITSFSHSYNSSSREGIKNYIQSFVGKGRNSFASKYDMKSTNLSANLAFMLNLAYKISNNQNISIKNIYTNKGERSTENYFGSYYNSDGLYDQTVLSFTEEKVWSSNLKYESYFESFYKMKLSVDASISNAKRDIPDLRTFHYVLNDDGNLEAVLSQKSNKRFYSFQDDINKDIKVKTSYKINQTIGFSLGMSYYKKDRNFQAYNFFFEDLKGQSVSSSLKLLKPEQLFTGENISNGLEFVKENNKNNSYKGNQDTYASYIDTDLKLSNELTLNLGLRFEYSNQKINTVSLIKTNDYLPVINVKYNVSETTNWRFAYSHTIARPEFREISSFIYQSYIGGLTTYGNPDLERTKIKNYDLRYELFPVPGELISASIFAKQFENPIELFYRASQQPDVTYKNVPNSDLLGLELEIRKHLMDNFSLSGNFSLIWSEVDFSNVRNAQAEVGQLKRPMYGQSPYSINLNAYYQLTELTDLSLSFNTFGKRISAVANNNQQEDAYELPFNKLDLSIQHKIESMRFKLSIKNILNDSFQEEQNDVIIREYKKGLDISLSASISL
jgi:outer membrane receptor protein involved in Fe transport